MAKYYDGYDGGEMISKDMSKMANLPQEVMIKEYPKVNSYLPEDYNDSISGIDSQIGQAASKVKSNLRK